METCNLLTKANRYGHKCKANTLKGEITKFMYPLKCTVSYQE